MSDTDARPARRSAARAAASSDDAPPAWRAALNAGPLAAALATAKAAVGEPGHAPFRARVSKAAVPDYGKYVAPAQEMWLDRVRSRLDRAEYESRAGLRADVAAIAGAARAYNGGGGACAAPALADAGEVLLAALDAALANLSDELDVAEAAAGEAGTASPPAAALHPPLPAGFEHEVRFTDAKPHGWAEYKIACPRHGEKRVDRLAKLANFFAAHAACRPEWRRFGRRPGEPDAAHLDRLRPVFVFCKALPGQGPGAPAAVPAACGRPRGAAAAAVAAADSGDWTTDDDAPPSPPLRRSSAALLAASAVAGTGRCPAALARRLGAAADDMIAAASTLAACESPPPRKRSLSPPPPPAAPAGAKRARSTAAAGVGVGGGAPPAGDVAALVAALADAAATAECAATAASKLSGARALLSAAADRLAALDAGLAASRREAAASRARALEAEARIAVLEAALAGGARATVALAADCTTQGAKAGPAAAKGEPAEWRPAGGPAAAAPLPAPAATGVAVGDA